MTLQDDLALIRAKEIIKRDIRKLIEKSKKAVSPYYCLELYLTEYFDKQKGDKK